MEDEDSRRIISNILRQHHQQQQEDAAANDLSFSPILRKKRRREESAPVLEPSTSYLEVYEAEEEATEEDPNLVEVQPHLALSQHEKHLPVSKKIFKVQRRHVPQHPNHNSPAYQQLNYVSQLAERQGQNNMLVRKAERRQMTESAIEERLQMMDVDLNSFSCCVPLCGRSFDSLQVLAWHASYAHQDSSVTLPGNAICLVCGLELENAKGKLAHLTTRHRDLMSAHSRQCMQMRGAFLAPQSPAALRVEGSGSAAHVHLQSQSPLKSPAEEFVIDELLLDDYTGEMAL